MLPFYLKNTVFDRRQRAFFVFLFFIFRWSLEHLTLDKGLLLVEEITVVCGASVDFLGPSNEDSSVTIKA